MYDNTLHFITVYKISFKINIFQLKHFKFFYNTIYFCTGSLTNKYLFKFMYKTTGILKLRGKYVTDLWKVI